MNERMWREIAGAPSRPREERGDEMKDRLRRSMEDHQAQHRQRQEQAKQKTRGRVRDILFGNDEREGE